MLYELTKSYLADWSSTKEIDESYPFYSPKSYLYNLCNCLFSLDLVKTIISALA